MNGVAGRDRNKEARWRRVVRRQARSGLSVRAWCREHGERESLLYWWRAELARRDEEEGEQKVGRAAGTSARAGGDGEQRLPGFVPVRVVEEVTGSSAGRIEIVLVGGRRIRVLGRVDRAELAEVVAVLEGQGC